MAVAGPSQGQDSNRLLLVLADRLQGTVVALLTLSNKMNGVLGHDSVRLYWAGDHMG